MSAPRRMGRYVVGERIGEGGLGEVFAAQVEGAEGFAKRVVVKRLRRGLAADAASIISDEAQTAQRLQHGGIVQVLDYGVDDDGSPYLVMERVEGTSLAVLSGRLALGARRIPVPEVVLLVEEVATALAYAHRQGVVHRDVTPGNILVSREGVVKLTDFGIARILTAPRRTVTGQVKGTFGYMAPEQAAGLPVGAPADQFSLATVLEELVEGRGDRDLEAVIARARALDPQARWRDMDEVVRELERWRVTNGLHGSHAVLAELVESIHDAPTLRVDERALRAQAPERATVAATPAAKRRTRKAWPWLLAGAVAAVATAAVVLASRSPSPPAPDSAPAPDPAPAPAPAPAPDSAPAPDPASASASASAPDSAPPPPSRRRSPRAHARLKVNVIPYARVRLDGSSLGPTPIDTEIGAGKHTLVLENPDTGKRVSKKIDAEPDGVVRVTSW